MPEILYEYILCRYGELSTKGKNRRNFTSQLLRNTKEQLKAFPDLKYRETYDRLYIELNGTDAQAVMESLRQVFGFSSFSLALKCSRELDELAQLAKDLLVQEEGKTFKVIARRHDKSFPVNSDTINRHIAAKILQESDWKVDVRKPDVNVYVEVRSKHIYLMMGKISGRGGYPVGIQGKAMLMLSGGIDSPVAAYLMMKRGVRIEAIHFASPPYTSFEAQKKVLDLSQVLTQFQAHIKVHMVPFAKIQRAIYDNVPESYAITLMRRFMLRIANRLAQRRHCLAIANGESLGQVASQTLQSMLAITKMESLPILRPLLSFDKLEIIDIAKDIKTYDISILPFEDCCTIFTPKNPVTQPHLDKIEAYEKHLDIEALVEDALQHIEVIDVHKEKKEESFL